MGLYDEKFSPFVNVPTPKYKKLHTVKKSQPTTNPTVEGDEEKAQQMQIFQETVKYGLSKKHSKERSVDIAKKVVYCLSSMSNTREKILGKSAKLRNGGKSYNRVVYGMLSGDNSSDQILTPEQFCDLYEFTLQHSFWKKFIKTPAGLQRNLLKLWDTDEYNSWSKANNKPESHRTTSISIPDTFQRKPDRGIIKADVAYDYDFEYISPEWEGSDNA